MKKTNRIRTHLLAGFLLAFLISHLPVLYTLFYHPLTASPTAVDGSIRLSEHYSGKRTILDGTWDFYWNRLIVTEPDHDAAPDFQISVPGYWSLHQLDGEYLPASGYASYRLTLECPDIARPVMVYLPDFGSAYRAYVDGKLVSESGVVAKNTAEVFTTPKATLYPVTLSEGTHELVIETATTRFSGLYKAPVLMDYANAVQGGSDRNNLRFILFGTVLFSFLTLTVVYFLSYRRGVRSAWLMALICCVLLRLMLLSEFYTFWQNRVFGGLSFEATNEVLFLISFALKFLMIFLYQEQFGIRFSGKEKTFFLLYYTAILLVHGFTPYGFYNRHLTVLIPAASFLLEIYAFCKVYFGERKLQPYALMVYWGTVTAIGGLIVDSYYANGSIYPNFSLVLLLTISVYMALLSIAYILRMVNVYREFELSSARLALARDQIAMQTEYYDALSAQMNEVRAVRHDVRHFAGALGRLADEGRYEELRRFLNEYAEKADVEPLPVFCENVVANSILGYYSLRMKEHGIRFRCACAIPKGLTVRDSDLCVVLGNALENAMEACGKLDNMEMRFVSAEARAMNGQLLIKISNPYGGSLNQKDGNYLTTKEGFYHGMGLKNIHRVVNACGGFVKTEHSETVFTLMAAFPEPASSIGSN